MTDASIRSSSPRFMALRIVLTAGVIYGLTNCGDPPEGSLVDSGGTQGSAGVAVGGGSGATMGSGQGGTINLPEGGLGDAGATSDGPCVGLGCRKTTCTLGACEVPPCEGNQPLTTISGTVFEPLGTVPLYNVVVYVPNGPVPAFTDGASCQRCDAAIANPVAAALTDTNGHFTLVDVPVGDNIPLVIQIGKWRRQLTVPSVPACVDTPLTDPNVTRLPRNKSEGDIPLIAITTGGADSMECLPRRMGIDDAEFTTNTGDGRIHLFYGEDGGGNNTVSTKQFADTLNGGADLPTANDLWDTVDTLNDYDIVILSCEGQTNEQSKPMSARQAMYDYASNGGRVFASHWHNIWFSEGPAPVPETGTWRDRPDPNQDVTSLGIINTSFPKGNDFADWLMNVMASTTRGQIDIIDARDNVGAVNMTHSTEWIRTSHVDCTADCTNDDGDISNQEQECIDDCTADPTAIEMMTFNAPLNVAEDQKCGRVVYNDLHVSATGMMEDPGAPFPDGCEQRPLSAQEKAVMFMLFDLSACIQDDDVPPMPPIVQ